MTTGASSTGVEWPRGAPTPIGSGTALRLHVVCAVSDKAVLHANWLAPSGDGAAVAAGQTHITGPGWAGATLVHQPTHAAAAFNAVAQRLARSTRGRPVRSAVDADRDTPSKASPNEPPPVQDWLVWVHQDVWWPTGWCAQFRAGLVEAVQRWPSLAVAGVYGLTGWGDTAVRAGEVCDRDNWLREAPALPCPASSLDELLVAVRLDSGLRMDASLGFDFYATDLCLQARDQGWMAAVLKAPCHHASGTPRSGPAAARTLARIERSAEAFERKWAQALPVFTPCFEIRQPGDVQAFIARHFEAVGHG